MFFLCNPFFILLIFICTLRGKRGWAFGKRLLTKGGGKEVPCWRIPAHARLDRRGGRLSPKRVAVSEAKITSQDKGVLVFFGTRKFSWRTLALGALQPRPTPHLATEADALWSCVTDGVAGNSAAQGASRPARPRSRPGMRSFWCVSTFKSFRGTLWHWARSDPAKMACPMMGAGASWSGMADGVVGNLTTRSASWPARPRSRPRMRSFLWFSTHDIFFGAL